MQFRVEIEREEDGRWMAEVPDLPGVMAYGPDRATAIAKVQALAMRVLADCLEHGGETRLAEACAMLDPAGERVLAEEGLASDVDAWPEY